MTSVVCRNFWLKVVVVALRFLRAVKRMYWSSTTLCLPRATTPVSIIHGFRLLEFFQPTLVRITDVDHIHLFYATLIQRNDSLYDLPLKKVAAHFTVTHLHTDQLTTPKIVQLVVPLSLQRNH